ncbi:autotransporter assembly complex protein TamA [Halovulum sp. GXIMD14793]
MINSHLKVLVLSAMLALAAQPAAAFTLFGFTLFEGKNKDEKTVKLLNPHNYTVSTAIKGDKDLRTALLDASALWGRRSKPASGAAGLISLARSDYQRLLATLYNNAYYGGVISIHINGREVSALPLTAKLPNPAEVVIRIDPGPRFVFGQQDLVNAPVGFKTGPAAPVGSNRRDFAPGLPARAEVIGKVGEDAVREWRYQGFPQARIAGREAIADHATNRLDTSITFDSGRKASFGRVTVQGSKRVNEDFIRYMANIPDGAPFTPGRIERAQARLAQMNVFRTVQIKEAEVLTADDQLPVIIEVEDRPMRRYGFGATYSNFDGLGLEAFWLHRNLFGRAERLRFDAQVSGLIERGGWQDYDYFFAASLSQPGIFDQDNVLRSSIQADQTIFDDYRQRQVGAKIGIDRNFRDKLFGGLHFETQFTQIEDIAGRRTFLTFGLPFDVTYDRRNSKADPTVGYYLKGEITPFTEVFYGNSAIRTTIEGRGYLSFGSERRTVLAARTAIGTLFGGDLQELPASQLFFAGGGGSVRGYDFRSIGVPSGGSEIGGRSKFEASLELRQRIGESFGFSAFIDGGMVSDQTFPFGSADIQYGAGLGVRWYTGIGPIRLDVARPLNPRPGDPDYAFYIGIGQAF